MYVTNRRLPFTAEIFQSESSFIKEREWRPVLLLKKSLAYDWLSGIGFFNEPVRKKDISDLFHDYFCIVIYPKIYDRYPPIHIYELC